MNKILSAIVVAIMLCMALSACGENSADNVMSQISTELSSDMMSAQDGTVSDSDGFIGNEPDDNSNDSSILGSTPTASSYTDASDYSNSQTDATYDITM